MISTWLITGDVNCNHLVKVVSARVLHHKVNVFSSLSVFYSVGLVVGRGN